MPSLMAFVMSESLSGPASVRTVPATAQISAITMTAAYLRQ